MCTGLHSVQRAQFCIRLTDRSLPFTGHPSYQLGAATRLQVCTALHMCTARLTSAHSLPLHILGLTRCWCSVRCSTVVICELPTLLGLRACLQTLHSAVQSGQWLKFCACLLWSGCSGAANSITELPGWAQMAIACILDAGRG